MATYTTTVVSDNPPPSSSVLRLTLKEPDEKKIWDDLQRKAQRTISPEELVAPLQGRTPLSKEECERVNAETRRRINAAFNKIKDEAEEALMIKPTDTLKTQSTKLIVQEKFIKWVSKLSEWFIVKLRNILAKLKEAFQWCVQTARELIESLCDFFSN